MCVSLGVFICAYVCREGDSAAFEQTEMPRLWELFHVTVAFH